MKLIRCLVPVMPLMVVIAQQEIAAQTVTELTTADEGGADIGLYNDNQRGAFTNQDGSGGVDIRNLGNDGVIDDSEVTRKRAGLLQFDLGEILPQQITSVDLELYLLQGSTTAEIEIYGVNDGADILGLAGDGSPGFDPSDPDFHFANSGLFNYYDHDDALFPSDDPIDDDDVVNDGFFDSTLDLDESKVELLMIQSEEGDEEFDGVISVFSSETAELLEFVQEDTNGKVLFLLMPTSGQAVTLNNGANGAAAAMFVTVDESIIIAEPGDYNADGVLDALDIDMQAAEMKKDPTEQDLAKFDHNNDGVVDVGAAGTDTSRWGDRLIWIRDLRKTSVGDSNFDGVFDSGDLVDAFVGGKYNTGEMVGWELGDWNGDMIFDSSDLVFAFTDGGYVVGAAPAAVPEPTALCLLILGVSLSWRRRPAVAAECATRRATT